MSQLSEKELQVITDLQKSVSLISHYENTCKIALSKSQIIDETNDLEEKKRLSQDLHLYLSRQLQFSKLLIHPVL